MHLEVHMSTGNLEAQVAAARAYEALFVPALFTQWGPIMVEAAQLTTGQSVLDVACGTGVLTRAAYEKVGPGGSVTGLDPGAGMLAVARERCPSVHWREGGAESMPFGEASFDAVVCQFGLMFMDQPRALREMLRVLKPGGRLAVAVWDSIENLPAFAAEVALLDRVAGSAAADALRAPFTLGDRKRLLGTFEEAGAGGATIRTQQGVARFPSIRVLVEADLRGWLPLMGVQLAEDTIAGILDAADKALGPYATADGRVVFDAPAHIVTVDKPQAAK
jgi:SAM-dependent methyltransferase